MRHEPPLWGPGWRKGGWVNIKARCRGLRWYFTLLSRNPAGTVPGERARAKRRPVEKRIPAGYGYFSVVFPSYSSGWSSASCFVFRIVPSICSGGE